MSSSLALLNRGLRRSILITQQNVQNVLQPGQVTHVLHTGHDRIPREGGHISELLHCTSSTSTYYSYTLNVLRYGAIRRRREYMSRHRPTCHQRLLSTKLLRNPALLSTSSTVRLVHLPQCLSALLVVIYYCYHVGFNRICVYLL